MTKTERQALLEDLTRLPVARRHMDQAATYLIEAGDGEGDAAESAALAALAAAHCDLARMEMLCAETAAAIDEASMLVEDRIIYSLNLDELPPQLLGPIAGGGTVLATGLSGEVGGYACPAGSLTKLMADFGPDGPGVVAQGLGCNVRAYRGLLWLELPAGDWQEVAGGIRRLVAAWVRPDVEAEDEEA